MLLVVLARGGGAGDIYSTEEVEIGTWVDGKPLYRKVVTGTIPPVSGTTYINVADNAEIINITGFVLPKSNASGADERVLLVTMLSSYDLQMTLSNKVYIVGNPRYMSRISLYSTNYTSSFVGRSVALIAEYTKTTD